MAFLPPGYDPATFPVGFEAPAPSGAANIIVPLAGPQGAQGYIGAQGPAGPQGAQGAQGAQG